MSCARVLIAGGGVAAVETLLALRHLAGDRVEIDLLAPTADFVYRPLTVLEPFTGEEAPRVPLGTIAREHDAGHVFDGIAAVEPESKTVRTTSGETFAYEVLVVATGARAVEALPGSLTFPGTASVGGFRRLLDGLVEGRLRSVAFTVPLDVSWTLPLYELALLTANFVKRRGGPAVRLVVVTPEQAPLAAFGQRASQTVEQLLREHAIECHPRREARAVTSEGVQLADGGVLSADQVVALPALVGLDLPGLPTDGGFVPVDEHGRVRGAEDVYAAGDVTSWTPKQGGLAAQQADVVAEAIADRVGAPVRPAPYRPVLRGVVLGGDQPAYIRSDRGEHRRRSIAALHPLWWPPAKVAGQYLAPYLAARGISVPSRLTQTAAGR